MIGIRSSLVAAIVTLSLPVAVLALAPAPAARQDAEPAKQFVLFDVTFPYTKEEADNATPSKSHWYVRGNMLNQKRPRDWTGPVDFRNGTVHIRTEVLEKPEGGEGTQWSVCYIPNRGQGNGYGCTNTSIYKEKGVFEKDVSMHSFWENESIIWSEGIKQIDLVMKDEKGNKTHTLPNPEKFFPTKVRIIAVQVAAGAKYDPTLVPNIPHEKPADAPKQDAGHRP